MPDEKMVAAVITMTEEEELALYREKVELKKLKKKGPPEAKLNMTPMIDVTFLLIVFFVVVTDLTNMEIESVALPFAMKAVEDDPKQERMIVNVTEKGKIRLFRQDFSEKELYREIKKRADKSPRDADGLPTLKVKIRADANAEYKHVQQVMIQCMRAYVWRISFGARPVADEESLLSSF